METIENLRAQRAQLRAAFDSNPPAEAVALRDQIVALKYRLKKKRKAKGGDGIAITLDDPSDPDAAELARLVERRRALLEAHLGPVRAVQAKLTQARRAALDLEFEKVADGYANLTTEELERLRSETTADRREARVRQRAIAIALARRQNEDRIRKLVAGMSPADRKAALELLKNGG